MATIHDVAKLAGVSIKTVSRVVNHEPGVREATRERVQKAIDQLQYKPHSGARLMRSSKSNLIGLVSSAISTVSRDPARAGLPSIHIVRGVQQMCREAGKTLLMIDTEPECDDIQDSIDILLAHRVEAIVHVLDYHRLIAPPAAMDIPHWLVNGCSTANIPGIVPDDLAGQAMAVDYLVSQGHQRLAYVGLPVEMEAGRLRREGFIQAASQHGLNESQLTVAYGMTLHETSYNAFSILPETLRQLIQQDSPPTAICFGNDLMALKAIPLLEAMGLSIPEDISIMGFDNDIAIALAARPQLTTVSLPYQRMGQVAGKALLAQLETPEASFDTVFPLRIKGEVVERESVAFLSEN